MKLADALQTFHLSNDNRASINSWTHRHPVPSKESRRDHAMGLTNNSAMLAWMARYFCSPAAHPHTFKDTAEEVAQQLREIAVMIRGQPYADAVFSGHLDMLAEFIAEKDHITRCPVLVVAAVADYYWRMYKNDVEIEGSALNAIHMAVLELWAEDPDWQIAGIRDEAVKYCQRHHLL